MQKFGSSVLTRHYLYNSDGSLVGEYTDSGAPVLELVKLGDLPVAVLTPAGTLYAQADHLSTVRALQNAAGVTVWRWESDPFGAALPDEDPDGNGIATVFPLRFPGQYYDAETGTHYNYHRDYDPAMGRYTQADPLGVAGGLNVYAYVGNDPVRMVDPLGLYGLPWEQPPNFNPFYQPPAQTVEQCVARCVVDVVNPIPDVLIEKGAEKAGEMAKGKLAGQIFGQITKKVTKVVGIYDAGKCVSACKRKDDTTACSQPKDALLKWLARP